MITVVVPASPIKSHPETAILDTTLDSIRHHLPEAEIILTFDGVRAEQQDRYDAYEEFIRRALWRADKHYGAVCPFIFEEHRHQSGMLRAVMDEIRTPLMMYVEADTPLVTDESIEWDAITEFILSGESNLVRFSHEASIHPEHKHLMLGQDGDLFMRTAQFSARPHVASVAYYRRLLESHFSEKSCCFLEDRLYGVVENAYFRDGFQGWNQHRLHLLTPTGNSIKRSSHLDGRAGEPKWDETQVY